MTQESSKPGVCHAGHSTRSQPIQGYFDDDELGEDSPIPTVGSTAIVSIIPLMDEGFAVLASS